MRERAPSPGGERMFFAIIGSLGLLGIFLFGDSSSAEVQEVSDSAASTKFDSLFQKWGTVYSIPWTWLKAIAMNESSLGTYPSVARGLAAPSDVEGSKSQDGKSWGIMQVTLTTARGLDPQATEVKLNNPDYSVMLAAKYLSQLATQFNRFDLRYTEYIVKSYNQGPGNTRKEISSGKGYADEYWARWQRNLAKIGG